MAGIAESKSHLAYVILENEIVTQSLQPGDIVNEKQLIDITKLGRTPTREAIHRLSWEGLIEIRPRSGIKISEIRPDDYVKIMEPRLSLEPILAKSVSRIIPKDYINELKKCVVKMEKSVQKDDNKIFLAADKRFDEILGIISPNQYLVKVLSPLQTHSRRFWYRFNSSDGPDETAQLHIDVITHIMHKEDDKAANSMSVLMTYLNSKARALII